MKVEEDERAKFDDGTVTVVLNMSYAGDDLPENVKQVYEYFRTGEFTGSNDMFGRLDEKVSEVNDTEREFIMTFEQELLIERNEGIAIGEERGKKEERMNSTREMLKDHVPVEKIMQYTNLSREEVEAIAAEG